MGNPTIGQIAHHFFYALETYANVHGSKKIRGWTLVIIFLAVDLGVNGTPHTW